VPQRPKQKYSLIAHRGGAGLWPENTLAAFAAALALGVDALEMDAHVTADGEIVIYHDSQLKPEITRTPDGRWLKKKGPAIRHLTLTQLKSYDVGRLKPRTLYARRRPHQTPVDGARIPTLWEIIALAKEAGNNTVEFWIETKISPLRPNLTPPPEAVADAVIAVVRQAGITNKTVLQSLDWRSLLHSQAVAPDIPTAYLTRRFGKNDTIQIGEPGVSPWTAGFDVDQFDGSIPRAIHAAGGTYWSPHFREVNQKQLEQAHSLGLKVVVWTPNRKPEMKRLIAMGVDGIMTDRPDLLREVLVEISPG
jgi:glycerophosphoryl diester phosphodiesterase